MFNPTDISIVLPAYNESENLVELIAQIQEQLSEKNFEIIVVDDCSSDDTLEMMRGVQDPRVHILQTERRIGLARSIRLGIEQSQGEYIIVMDSDFNHQPRYLNFMVQSMVHYDCAFASRFTSGGGMESFWRQILSRIYNIFIQLVTGNSIRDNLYGFYIVKRAKLEECPYDDIFWGFGEYCIRLIYFLQRNQSTILQFPALNGVRRYGRGNPRLLRTFINYTIEIVKFSCKIHFQRL